MKSAFDTRKQKKTSQICNQARIDLEMQQSNHINLGHHVPPPPRCFKCNKRFFGFDELKTHLSKTRHYMRKPMTRQVSIPSYSKRVSNTEIRVSVNRFSKMLDKIDSQNQQLLAQQDELQRNQSLIAYDRKIYYVYVAMSMIGVIVIFELFG